MTESPVGPAKSPDEEAVDLRNNSENIFKGNGKDSKPTDPSTSLKNLVDKIKSGVIQPELIGVHENTLKNSSTPLRYVKEWKFVLHEDGKKVVKEWVEWNDGMPYTVKLKFKKNEEKKEDEEDGSFVREYSPIVLKNYNTQNGSIQEKIDRCMGKAGNELILYDGEVFSKEDFVKEFAFPKDFDKFTFALEALPLRKKVIREPSLYEDNGFLKFPDHPYASREESYQKVLIDNLNLGKVDQGIYDEGISLMKKFPKQITLFYAIVGSNIINVLKLNHDYNITVEAIGSSDSGKSFVIYCALKLCYGIGQGAVIGDDSMNAHFRHHAIAGSTNLILYIEEAKIKDKKMLKSIAKNIRGNPNKTLKIYGNDVTIVLSMNTEEQEDNENERKAIEKRVPEFYFDDSDVVPSEIRSIGKKYLNKLSNISSGLLYDKLEQKPIELIKQKYFELLESEKGNIKRIVSLMGAWLMDDSDFIPTFSDPPSPEILMDFYSWIILSAKKSQDIYLRGREFKVPSATFKRFTSSYKINTTCKAFAERHPEDLKYKSINFDGDNWGKGIIGVIPTEIYGNKEDYEHEGEGYDLGI